MWKTPNPTAKYPDSTVWVCALFSCLSEGSPLSSRLSGGATEPTPLDPTPSEPLPPDLIRTRFWPDFDLIRTEKADFGSESGQNQVKSRTESGPQVRGEGFGGGRVKRGRSGWEGSVAGELPRNYLCLFDSVNAWCAVFFPFLTPLTCGRQSRCLGWTYKLLSDQKFSSEPSPLL